MADFDTKLISFNKKINSSKTKKLQTFDSSYFRDKSHFEEDGAQDYLVFQPMYRYFKRIAGVGRGNYIHFWKSKGFPDGNVTPPVTPDYSFAPKLNYFGIKTRVEFKGSCLKQDKIMYNYRKTKNIYIVYELSSNFNNFDFALEINCSAQLKLKENADIDKYKYSGYGIKYDYRGTFFIS